MPIFFRWAEAALP